MTCLYLQLVTKSAFQNLLCELKYFPLRLCVNMQFYKSPRLMRVAVSRKGAKLKDKLAKSLTPTGFKMSS
ncbi:MAG: hypothetical protein AUG51_08210 [Acidobacteria bacterium 13_1_20CM_3_53_8]|nr:MAG: hypothetical protein AUG51_08210 [Acidobacteria bacterium 13_1_20CM_3_53_8]